MPPLSFFFCCFFSRLCAQQIPLGLHWVSTAKDLTIISRLRLPTPVEESGKTEKNFPSVRQPRLQKIHQCLTVAKMVEHPSPRLDCQAVGARQIVDRDKT
ncbi:hypothetical protein V8C42DRAFT_330855 [Trichoderma barbatum]